jgi:Ca2+-binding EF-hand superfamily protein
MLAQRGVDGYSWEFDAWKTVMQHITSRGDLQCTLRRMFRTLDVRCEGHIDRECWMEAVELSTRSVDLRAASDAFDVLTCKGDGKLSRAAFLSAMLQEPCLL